MAHAVPAIAVIAAALCGISAPVAAQSLPVGELRHNGELSRRLFVPSATASVGSERVSAGLALGLKGPVRQQMGRVAPAVTIDMSPSSKLSILGAPGKGAMVILQTAAW